jgi:transposase InsO family protein
VDTYRELFDIETICTVIGFSPSTYYAARKRAEWPSRRAQRDAELIPLIRRPWEDSNQLYGARKIWKQLRRDGVDIARCTVERLMRAEGMAGVVATRYRPRTTVPGDAACRPRDLVERDFTAPAPNQLWVTDITYVELAGGGFCYAAFVTDVFSRAIVGWQVSDTLKAELALDALEMAWWSRKDQLSVALVHHSDRGVQLRFNRSSQHRCFVKRVAVRSLLRQVSSSRWAASAPPWTTPSPNRSTPRSRSNTSTATGSAPAPRRD